MRVMRITSKALWVYINAYRHIEVSQVITSALTWVSVYNRKNNAIDILINKVLLIALF